MNTLGKTCFVACPIGAEGSPARVRADALIDLIIRPALGPAGYSVTRQDREPPLDEPLPDQIIESVVQSDLLIADLTDSNPNVMYELGLRHATLKPSITMLYSAAQRDRVPFDVRHRGAIRYSHLDSGLADRARKNLLEVLRYIEAGSRPTFPDALGRFMAEANKVIGGLVEWSVGPREPYRFSLRLLANSPVHVFLMQRSSTMVLGPESGWGEEKDFYEQLLKQIRGGMRFTHVVSLEGIERHLRRPQSSFPDVGKARRNLARDGENVVVRAKGKSWPIKRIPEVIQGVDIKPDRQGRVFACELPSGQVDVLVVFDIGNQEATIHLRGAQMRGFLDACLDFHKEHCVPLKWSELERVCNGGNK